MMTNQTAGEQVPIISATAGFSEASILLQTESKPSKELDTKRIGFLVREEERSDIEAFLENHPQCSEEYIPVAIIGEGTFSTVYKAIDVQHYRRNNSRWIPSSRQDQWDCARLLALMTAIESTVGARARARNSILRSRLYTSIRKFMIDEYSAGKFMQLQSLI